MPAGGIDWVAVQAALHSYVVAGSGLSASQVVWGQQDAPRPEGPSIVMRFSNLAEQGRPWLDVENNPVRKPNRLPNAGTETYTAAGHGLLTGDGPVRLTTTGTLPGNLTLATDYWVIRITADTFKLASSFPNAMNATPVAIDISSNGTGTHSVEDTAETLRAGAELLGYARGFLRATLELRCHSAVGVGLEMATSILQRIRSRRPWMSQRDLLTDANIGMIDIERVRAILGIRDALLFEPRAVCEMHLSIPLEEAEHLGIIEHAEVENLLTHVTVTIPE